MRFGLSATNFIIFAKAFNVCYNLFMEDKKVFNLNNAIKYEQSDGKDRVFISYQSNSFEFVLKLSDYLESNGVKTWYAPRNIKFGSMWPAKLCEAIKNCKVLLLLYTQEADRSKHVMREVQLADDFMKPILWLKLDNSNPSKTLKYFLSLIQSLEWDGDKDRIFSLLLKILQKDKIDVSFLSSIKDVNTRNSTKDIAVNQWSKGIYAFSDANQAGECVARVYFAMAKENPDSTLLLPTGRSAKSVFYGMIRVANEYDGCPFGDAHIMNDTETFGVAPTHATSRIKTINDYLINPLNGMGKGPSEDRLNYFYGIDADDIDTDEKARMTLEKYPPSAYGISVSPFCEIIGYDIGSHDESIVNDGPQLIKVNDETKDYIDRKQKSNSIYTVGMGTALKSKLLMVLAFDKEKCSAIERLLKEDIDANAPITLLRKHPNAFLILTNDIIEKIGIEKYAVMDLSPEEAAKCILR